MQATLDNVINDTATVSTFWFALDKSVDFTAGQFVELTVPHDAPDSRGIKRWFTLSSSPTDDKLAITTKFSPQNGSTFKQALRRLKPGATVSISAPMGDFVLPKLTDVPVIMVAGGIGITPYLSMFRWLQATGQERPIRLIQSVASEDEIAFQEVFEGIKQHATIIVSGPSAAWGGERGRITAEMIIGLERPSPDTLVYISGPEPLVESLTHDLQTAGINKQQLLGDYFPNYPAE